MKLLVTSDLHLGITQSEVILNGMKRCLTKEIDAVILAGDLVDSRSDAGFARQDALVSFLQAKSMLPLGYVMGNHDFWANNGPRRYEKWRTYLTDARRDSHAVHLEQANIYLPQENSTLVAIVGGVAWYDYSARDMTLPHGPAWYEANKPRLMRDAEYMQGWPADPIFARNLQFKFMDRLKEAQKRADVEKIVVVTHVPVFEEQMERKPDDVDWSLGNAYFGNLTMGNMLKHVSKVKLVVSGHTHTAKDVMVDGIRAVVVGSDYGAPKWLTLEV